MSGVAQRPEDLGLASIEPEKLRAVPEDRPEVLWKHLDALANRCFDDPVDGSRALFELARRLKAAYEGRDDVAPGPAIPRMGSGGSMSTPDVRPVPRIPRPFALERELALYRSRLQELRESHPGEHVLIKDDEVVGFFASFEEALEAAYGRFGNVPFFIKEVGAEDVVFLLPRTL